MAGDDVSPSATHTIGVVRLRLELVKTTGDHRMSDGSATPQLRSWRVFDDDHSSAQVGSIHAQIEASMTDPPVYTVSLFDRTTKGADHPQQASRSVEEAVARGPSVAGTFLSNSARSKKLRLPSRAICRQEQIASRPSHEHPMSPSLQAGVRRTPQLFLGPRRAEPRWRVATYCPRGT